MEEQEAPDSFLNELLFTKNEDKLHTWFGCDITEGLHYVFPNYIRSVMTLLLL